MFSLSDIEPPSFLIEVENQTANVFPALSHSRTITWDAVTATDNSGSVTVTSTHNSGDSFNVGTTLVTYTARDANGNYAVFSFNVSIYGRCTDIQGRPTDLVYLPGSQCKWRHQMGVKLGVFGFC